MDMNSMGIDLDRGPVSNLDNDSLSGVSDVNMTESDNKMSESMAAKTAKLHQLLGSENSEKSQSFHLDLESPESE